MRKILALFAGPLILSACASSGVVPMDRGTFLITKRSTQVGTGAPVGTQAKVYTEANAFCAKDGMAVETVNLETSSSRVAHPGSVALQFKCVPK